MWDNGQKNALADLYNHHLSLLMTGVVFEVYNQFSCGVVFYKPEIIPIEPDLVNTSEGTREKSSGS
jgi:hypothetical protein